jgi:TonB family protein
MHIDNPPVLGRNSATDLNLNLNLNLRTWFAMPDHPVPEPESSTLQGVSPAAESDLGELAALFAAHAGGSFSAEVSAQLALEIVLNEIVEQACLATGATGAAIVLVRDGEMVCRASSGANAPVLGAPLGSESGLTAECIKSWQVQRCDDAQADPRADGEASRRLGVRSVMVLPLLREDELAGVLEVFSSRAGAFGERDEITLEALAQRILRNLERASAPLPTGTPSLSESDETAGSRDTAGAAVRNAGAEAVVPWMRSEPEDSRADSGASLNREEEDVPLEIVGRSERAGFDGVSLALGAAVLICAVLLGTLMGVRLGWRRAVAMRAQVTKAASGSGFVQRREAQSAAQNGVGQNSVGQNSVGQNGVAQAGATQAGGELGANALSAVAPPVAASAKAAGNEKRNAVPPAGSLLVYDNGKEVFRMPPAAEGEAESATGTNESGAQSAVPGAVPGEVQRASAVEPAGILELAPEAAQGSLVHRVEPEYPEEARQQGIQGPVVLEVRIGRDGAIQDVKLVSGPSLLANAAIAAVKQWRFKPRVRKGQAVEMQTRVTLNFRMPA